MSIFDLAIESAIVNIMPTVDKFINDKSIPKDMRKRMILAKRMIRDAEKDRIKLGYYRKGEGK